VTVALFVAGAGALDGAAAGSELVLDGDEGRHACVVRRIRAGEVIDVADGRGLVARCRVDGAERDRLRLTVQKVTAAAARLPYLVLVQALAKGGRDEAAVETATEYGVDAVIPWQAERCVVQWAGERGERSRRRWEATAVAAAKQSRRARVPAVQPALSTGELAAGLAARQRDGELILVLHEDAEQPLSSLELPPRTTAVLLLVGPEGGVSQRELARLTSAGATAVRLGPEVLRASSAGPAALAVLSLRLGRW
jgi:16S rRNA (uracil1498-N3)-methyltransferase